MSKQEQNILDLETKFLSLSGSAFSAAFKQTLASGQSVLVSHQGAIYRVYPNGDREFVKKIDPPTPVAIGTTIKIP